MNFNEKKIKRKAIAICALGTFAFSPVNYNKESADPPVSYVSFEKTIRAKYDSYAVFKWERYIDFLNLLSQDKFLVLPLNEMRNTYSKSKVVIGLRHDVDLNPFKALEMAKLEKMYGIKSTYFMLATSDYYGKISNSGFSRNEGMNYIIREIHNTGAEIGIHNDL